MAAVRTVAPDDSRRKPASRSATSQRPIGGDVLQGVDAIVHLAGRAHVPPGPAADATTPFIVANVHVTRRLAEAAAQAGVTPHRVSRAASRCTGTRARRAVRSAPATPAAPQDAYARSKAEAENALGEICRANGIEVIVLRLPLTYGPGVKGNFLHPA